MQIRAQVMKNAIGEQLGDNITLENQWAKVQIIYGANDEPGSYFVYGDVMRAPLTTRDVRIAYAYALESLAHYQHGRVA